MSTSQASIFLLLLTLIFLGGCTKKDQPLFVQPTQNTIIRTQNTQTSQFLSYGFFPYWSKTPTSFEKFDYISFFSLEILSDGSIVPQEKSPLETLSYIQKKISSLRGVEKGAKKITITLSMMGQEDIPIFFSSSSAQEKFRSQLEKIVQTTPIDGINIDVEYSGNVDTTLQDSFARFVAVSAEVLRSHSPESHISVSTYADSGHTPRITKLSKIAPIVDHIVMMSYDYHTNASVRVGPNAPLYGKKEYGFESDVSFDLAAYLQEIPAQKIVLGIPLYGRQWEVVDHDSTTPFSLPKTGSSVMLRYIPNIRTHYQIEETVDPITQTPFAFFEKQQKKYVLHYENTWSIQQKILLAKQLNLAGVAFWALGYEPSSFFLSITW